MVSLLMVSLLMVSLLLQIYKNLCLQISLNNFVQKLYLSLSSLTFLFDDAESFRRFLSCNLVTLPATLQDRVIVVFARTK